MSFLCARIRLNIKGTSRLKIDEGTIQHVEQIYGTKLRHWYMLYSRNNVVMIYSGVIPSLDARGKYV